MTVKRPGRRARREIRSRKVIAPRPPRRVHVSMLDDAGCEEMHVDVKEILWVIGFAVCDAATRRRLTLEHKRLEGEGDYPRIPPDLVERALSTVSPSVRLHRRDGTLALDVIKRAAPENTFVNDGHTYDRYLGGMWLPELFTRSTIEDFQISDQTPLRTRLDERVSEIPRN